MANGMSWHHMPAQDVLFALESTAVGLSPQQVKERQAKRTKSFQDQYRPTSWTRIFAQQIVNPLVAVLAIAAALSFALGKWEDALLTLAIVFLQALLGFVQEYKADRALHRLRSMLPVTVRVKRAGRAWEIPAVEVVVGDIMLLRAGDRVLADGRILQATDFAANESPLTGESAEVAKGQEPVAENAIVGDRKSMVFAGSTIMSGKAEVVVTAMGDETEFGKVTKLVGETVEQETPLQRELRQLSRVLVVIMVAAAVTVFALGELRGIPVTDMLSTAAALAVAAIPESLLVSLTVILAVGMRRMVKRNALTRRLLAAETLGSVNVMCVDKTGTLTTGEMTVTEVRLGLRRLDVGHPSDDLYQFLRDIFLSTSVDPTLLHTTLEKAGGSVTERSMIRFLSPHREKIDIRDYSLLSEIPFNSERKYSARLFNSAKGTVCFVLGAPDVLLTACDLKDSDLQAYHRVHQDMIARGLRVVFLAEKRNITSLSKDGRLPPDLVPVGFVGLEDPVRDHAAETLLSAKKAGVRTMMVTGDHPTTAALVAHELGLPAEKENMLTGQQIREMTDEELQDVIPRISVCARVLPEQKVRIVKALQSRGDAVAMTGDGVNDAPALRAADIGVAVGSGTDVAKEPADMVLLDNDVRSLVAAIREGRVIFDNIRKVITYLLTFSFSEVVVIAAVIAVGLPLPFSPLHILWINLVTDGLPSIALAFEPQESGVMQEPPRRRGEPVINASMRSLMLFAGGVAVVGLLALYAILLQSGATVEYARTMLFMSLGLDSLAIVYALRLLRKSCWQSPPWSNPSLALAVTVSLGCLLAPLFVVPLRNVFGFVLLTPESWLLLGGIVFAKMLLIEVGKMVFLGDIRRGRRLLVS